MGLEKLMQMCMCEAAAVQKKLPIDSYICVSLQPHSKKTHVQASCRLGKACSPRSVFEHGKQAWKSLLAV